jgi:ferrochelatase
MPRFLGTSKENPPEPGVLGVLIANLGTPDAPTPAALRRYLAEFLWDPRVVEWPRLPWWLVLHGVILRLRPRRAAHAYRRVWTAQGSPLLVHAQTQCAALQAALSSRLTEPVCVTLGMRYGNPSIAAALEVLRERGVRRLTVLPLYPQYSASATAAVFDAATRVLSQWRALPELRFIRDYHDDDGYLAALAQSVEQHWREHGAAERLLISFHGIPQRMADAGDPYARHCEHTARLLAARLNLAEHRWQLSYQSRFGREPWLLPATDQTLRDWAQQGVTRADVICPGFSADCLETLEEIAIENRRVFLEAGGREYRYIPALNATPAHIAALTGLVLRHNR